VEVNGDRVTPEAAKIPDNVKTFTAQTVVTEVKPITGVIGRPRTPQKPKKPAIRVVDPPPFHPVRTTTTDAGFVNRLKVREFVLKCILL
jgi:hypothetical protein